MIPLDQRGWSSHFARQLSLDEFAEARPARIVADHGRLLLVDAGTGPFLISLPGTRLPGTEERRPTVGDWLLLDPTEDRPTRLLEAYSLFQRKAAGHGTAELQAIAANVDTAFIATSCNRDFNEARLERFLALVTDSGATPVVILTKADLSDAPESFADRARALLPGLLVETLDARSEAAAAALDPWLGAGRSVALIGTSGVGKTTLTNTLLGSGGDGDVVLARSALATQAAREFDDRGRHTTSTRVMHRLPGGAYLIDTPGMRELALAEVGEGLANLFSDLEEIATHCRFRDCRHQGEPGCAVNAAIADGTVDAGRVARWLKLAEEEQRNSETVAETRRRMKGFGKMVRRAMDTKTRMRSGEEE